MKAKQTHGGRGRGQGRPPLSDEPTERITITLPASYLEYLKTVGSGNISNGVRILIERTKEIHSLTKAFRFNKDLLSDSMGKDLNRYEKVFIWILILCISIFILSILSIIKGIYTDSSAPIYIGMAGSLFVYILGLVIQQKLPEKLPLDKTL